MWLVNKKAWEKLVGHVATLNNEMGSLEKTQIRQGNDLDWVKKLQWAVLVIVLGNFVLGTAALVLKLLGIY